MSQPTEMRRPSTTPAHLPAALLLLLLLAQGSPALAQEPPAVQVTAAPGRGFTLTTSDNRLSVTLRTRAQIRETLAQHGTELTNEINVKTLRLIVQGHVLEPSLRYNIQLAFGGNDFERDSASPIFDAFVEHVGLRDLNVRFGQFFVPFDRARTMREFALQMVDRPLVVRELTLDRDVGLMLSSTDLFGTKVLGYHLFVGGGEGRNRFGPQAVGPLVVGRLVFRPWGVFDEDIEGDLSREARPRLALGLAAAYNDATNRQNSTYGTTYTLGTVSYLHAAADLVFKYSGFSLLAEGVLRRPDRNYLESTTGETTRREWTRSGHGYLVQAGMMVTPLVEVTARWEQLFTRGETDPQLQRTVDEQGRQLGGGLNLYLNGHAFKLQGDYIYSYGLAGLDGRHLVRLQLDASF